MICYGWIILYGICLYPKIESDQHKYEEGWTKPGLLLKRFYDWRIRKRELERGRYYAQLQIRQLMLDQLTFWGTAPAKSPGAREGYRRERDWVFYRVTGESYDRVDDQELTAEAKAELREIRGERLDPVRLCPNCKATIRTLWAGDIELIEDHFCPKCGTNQFPDVDPVPPG